MKVAATAVLALGLLDSTARAADAPSADPGEQVYTRICQGCHMANGEGATGAGTYPKLAGNPRLVAWQYAAITVLQGRNGMPAFGGIADVDPSLLKMMGALTDEQIAAVVNYVRTHFGNSYKEKASASEVKALPHPGGKGAGHAG
jgi:mono/diheme cytochrome c family protein